MQVEQAQQAVVAVIAQLRDDRAKQRKEGIRAAAAMFDNPDILRVLDSNTLALRASEKEITIASWPVLGEVVKKCVALELAQAVGKKRGMDAGASKLFKRVVELAEASERRTGAHCFHSRLLGAPSLPTERAVQKSLYIRM
jgi:hypothetical protein